MTELSRPVRERYCPAQQEHRCSEHKEAAGCGGDHQEEKRRKVVGCTLRREKRSSEPSVPCDRRRHGGEVHVLDDLRKHAPEGRGTGDVLLHGRPGGQSQGREDPHLPRNSEERDGELHAAAKLFNGLGDGVVDIDVRNGSLSHSDANDSVRRRVMEIREKLNDYASYNTWIADLKHRYFNSP